MNKMELSIFPKTLSKFETITLCKVEQVRQFSEIKCLNIAKNVISKSNYIINDTFGMYRNIFKQKHIEMI